MTKFKIPGSVSTKKSRKTTEIVSDVINEPHTPFSSIMPSEQIELNYGVSDRRGSGELSGSTVTAHNNSHAPNSDVSLNERHLNWQNQANHIIRSQRPTEEPTTSDSPAGTSGTGDFELSPTKKPDQSSLNMSENDRKNHKVMKDLTADSAHVVPRGVDEFDSDDSDDASRQRNLDDDGLSSSIKKKKKKGYFSALKVPKAFKGGKSRKIYPQLDDETGSFRGTPKGGEVPPIDGEYFEQLSSIRGGGGPQLTDRSANSDTRRSDHGNPMNIAEASRRIMELIQQIHNLEEERGSLQMIIETKDSTIYTLKEEVEELEAKMSELLPDSRSPKASLKLTELGERISNLQSEIITEREGRQKAEAELRSVKAELETAQNEIKASAKRIAELEAIQMASKDSVEAKEEKVNELQKRLETAEKEAETLTAASKHSEDEIIHLKSQLSEREQQSALVRDENGSLRRQLELMKASQEEENMRDVTANDIRKQMINLLSLRQNDSQTNSEDISKTLESILRNASNQNIPDSVRSELKEEGALCLNSIRGCETALNLRDTVLKRNREILDELDSSLQLSTDSSALMVSPDFGSLDDKDKFTAAKLRLKEKAQVLRQKAERAAALEAENSAMKSKCAELQETISKAQLSLDREKSVSAEHASRCETLTQRLNEQQDQIKMLDEILEQERQFGRYSRPSVPELSNDTALSDSERENSRGERSSFESLNLNNDKRAGTEVKKPNTSISVRQRLKDATAALTDKQGEVDRMEKILNLRESEIERLTKTVAELDDKLNQSNLVIKEGNNKVNQAQHDMIETERRYNQCAELIKTIVSSMRRLATENSHGTVIDEQSLSDENIEAEAQRCHENLTSIITGLKRDLAEAKLMAADVKEELTDSQTVMDQLRADLRSLRNDVSAKESEIAQINRRHQELQASHTETSALNQVIDRLNTELEAKKKEIDQERRRHDEEFDQQASQISKHEAELSNMNDRLKEELEKVHYLEDEIMTLEKTHAENRAQFQKELSALESQLGEVQDMKAIVQTEKENLSKEIQTKIAEIESLKSALMAKETELNERDESVKALASEREVFKADHLVRATNQKKEYDDLKVKHEQMVREYATMEAKLTAATSDMGAEQKNVVKLKGRLEETEQEVKEVQKLMAGISKTLQDYLMGERLRMGLGGLPVVDGGITDESLRLELDKLVKAHDIERSQWEIRFKESETAKAENQLQRRDHEKSLLQTQRELENCRDDLTTCRVKLEATSEKLAKSEISLQNVKGELEKVNTDKIKAEAQCSVFKADKERLEEKITGQQKIIDELKEQIIELKRNVRDRIDEIEQLKNAQESTVRKREAVESGTKRLQDQLKSSLDMNAELSRVIREKEKQTQDAVIEIDVQKAHLNRREEEIKALKQTEERLREEIKALNESVQVAEAMARQARSVQDAMLSADDDKSLAVKLTRSPRPGNSLDPPEVTVYSNVIAHLNHPGINFVRSMDPAGTHEVVICLKSRLVEALFENMNLGKPVNGQAMGGIFRDLFNSHNVSGSMKETEGRPEVIRVLTRVRNLWQLGEDLRLALVQGDAGLANLYQKTKTRHVDWESTLNLLRGSAKMIEERNDELEKLSAKLNFSLEEARSLAKVDREKAKSVVSALKEKLRVTEQMRVAAEAERDSIMVEMQKLQDHLRSSLTDNDRLKETLYSSGARSSTPLVQVSGVSTVGSSNRPVSGTTSANHQYQHVKVPSLSTSGGVPWPVYTTTSVTPAPMVNEVVRYKR